MATFLELVRMLARESGTLAGGDALPTLASPTARANKLINWVRDAWIDLQNDRQDWPWMRGEFESPLTIGKARYTAAELGVTRFSVWLKDRPRFRTSTIYDPAEGRSDQGEIRYVDYDEWRRTYGRGHHDPDRPMCWTVSPTNEFVVGPVPSKAFVLTGEYRKAPQVLTVDGDVPEMPAQYHKAIVWVALKLLGLGDESPITVQGAVSEYVLTHQNLMRDFAPEITIGGGPLA